MTASRNGIIGTSLASNSGSNPINNSGLIEAPDLSVINEKTDEKEITLPKDSILMSHDGKSRNDNNTTQENTFSLNMNMTLNDELKGINNDNLFRQVRNNSNVDKNMKMKKVKQKNVDKPLRRNNTNMSLGE